MAPFFWLALPLLIPLFASPVRAAQAGPTDPLPLKEKLTAFVAASKPNRSVGQPGHETAFKFIQTEFEKLAAASGGTVRVHPFVPDVEFAASNYQADFKTLVEGKIPPKDPQYARWKAFTETSIAFVRRYREREGRNLILEIRGTRAPGEVLYVGAHYDTTTHDRATMSFTPERPTDGADDNASGLTALLAVAGELAATKPERTIRFVAFDYEEISFLGSYALAKDLAQGKLPWAPASERAIGLLNLEMIGWSGAANASSPVMKIYTRKSDDPAVGADLKLAVAFESASRRLKLHDELRPVIFQNGFNRSDNWAFWQWKIPAICITEDWEGAFNEKHYHTSGDTADTLNFDYLSHITRTTAETVRVLSKK